MKGQSLKELMELAPRETGVLMQFTNDRIASKLITMGIFPGMTLELVRYAPFKGGCYVKADNRSIAIRRDEAQCILLQA
jgi:ferrous iron transport protein A